MSMQLLAAVAIVGAATLYVLNSLWRAWAGGSGGCGSGCGKCSDRPEPPGGSRIPLNRVEPG